MWQHQIRDLADVAEMIVPSLHGYDSLPAMAEAVLDCAPDRFALAGFSMGGRVALEVFRLAPQRITRLALLDASAHPVAEGEAVRRQPQIELARQEGIAALADWWNPKLAHPAVRDDPAFMDLLHSMACTFTPEDYEKEVGALLTRPDPRPLLGQINVPVLVLAGADDPIAGPERTRELAESIRGSTLVSIEGAGHFPMLEKPEQVTAAMRRWLAA